MVRLAHPLITVHSPPAVIIEQPRAHDGRSTTAAAGIIALAFVLVSAAVSLYLAQVSSVATAGYQLAQLESERKEWVARNGQLELELAKRRSLVWSEAEAIQRLGMTRAPRPVYVPVETTAVVECGALSAPCEADLARSTPAAPVAKQARPAPGNPIHAIDDFRGWLISLRRLDE